MKRSVRIILFAAALLTLSGCVNKFKQVKITSAAIESLSPSGMKRFDAVVALGIDNPAPSFNIMNLKADVRKDTVAILHLTGENVAVQGKSSKVYRVPVTAEIDPSVSLLQLAIMARNFNPELYVVDLSAKAMVAGVGKNLVYNDIPLSSLLEKASQ